MHRCKLNLIKASSILLIFVILQILPAGNLFAAEDYYNRIMKRLESGETDTMESAPEGFSDITSESVEKIEDWEQSKGDALGREEIFLSLEGPKAGAEAIKSTDGKQFEISPDAQILNTIELSDGNNAILWHENGKLMLQIVDDDQNALLAEAYTIREHGVGAQFTSAYMSKTQGIEGIYIGYSVDLYMYVVSDGGPRSGTRHRMGGYTSSPTFIDYSSLGPRISVTSSMGYQSIAPLSRELFRSLTPTTTFTIKAKEALFIQDGNVKSNLIEQSLTFTGFEDVYIPESYEEFLGDLEDSFEKYGYLDTLKALISEETLDNFVTFLEGKEDKKNIEEGVLELSKLALASDEYIDDETMQSFQEAVHLVLIAENMKGLLEGVDFGAITQALSDLVSEQKSLYSEHLVLTESIYRQLEGILMINLDDEVLPDRYLKLNLSPQAKRKILIDIALRKLETKDKKDLKENEIRALQFAVNALSPLQGRYKEELKRILSKFIFNIKKNLADVKPASTVEEEGKFKALFHLKK